LLQKSKTQSQPRCRYPPEVTGLVLPSRVRFVRAAGRPFFEYRRKPGKRVGPNWRVTNNLGKRSIRYLLFDTNSRKSFVQARLVSAQGDPGGLSLFEELAVSHWLFAEHLTSEYRIRTEGCGRTVGEWRSRGHSIFIADLPIRNPGQQARFFAATIAQVSVCAHQEWSASDR
jgi:hypothetical protein